MLAYTKTIKVITIICNQTRGHNGQYIFIPFYVRLALAKSSDNYTVFHYLFSLSKILTRFLSIWVKCIIENNIRLVQYITEKISVFWCL